MNILKIYFGLFLGLMISMETQAKEYNILDFGAVADTTVISTQAIQNAIDVCNAGGGGRVVIPSGNFKTGTIIFKSHVELYLEEGATLWGSKNISDYPGIKPGYVSLRTQNTTRQLIYAENADHIAISGLGEINGQGKSFVRTQSNDEGVLRPHLIRFISCQYILVLNISLRNSGAWMEHYLACEHVQIRGIKIYNHNNFNNDGIDLDGCKNVTVSDVICDSDDDGITLKSTSPKPCENIAITNCVVSSHCNAIKMGTETNGGFRNITISNCVIKPSDNVNEEFRKTKIYGQLTGITGISLEIVDGGTMDGICISNIRIEGTHSPIFIRLGNRARSYKEGLEVAQVGSIRNVSISNVFINSEKNLGCSITGLPGHPVENIHLNNIYFQQPGGGQKEDMEKVVPEKDKSYPEGTMFGVLPASGFYVRHARHVSFNGGDFSTIEPDARPAFVFDDVDGGELSGLNLWVDSQSGSGIWLDRSQNIVVRGCILRGAPNFFLRVSGMETRSITLTGNIVQGKTGLVSLNDVPKKEIKKIR